MLIVVAYDIPDDRRRTNLHTLLLGFGEPIQESVFECDLTATEFQRLQRRVSRLVRPPVDNVRYYPLCAECALNVIDASGIRRPPTPNVTVL